MRPNATSRIALVLGAGGTVGCAYHAGVLFSLQHHLGWDPRHADTVIGTSAGSVIGTSAGSVIGALLRSGVAADDLVALFTGASPGENHRTFIERYQEPLVATDMSNWSLVSRIRPPTVRGLGRSLASRSAVPALLSMARPGRRDLTDFADGLAELSGGEWPEQALLVCAAGMHDGRRRILSRHSGIALETAVSASCAVPGLIAPVHHDGDTLVDGGVRSTTNADLVPHTVDEVWVIAPMAIARDGSARNTGERLEPGTLRRIVTGRLERELRTLPTRLPVRVFAPSRDTRRSMGRDLMAGDRALDVVRSAFFETGDSLLAS